MTNNGIWSKDLAINRVVAGKNPIDFTLAGAIGQYYQEKGSMADLGCCTGYYSKIFDAMGWDVEGYEGTEFNIRPLDNAYSWSSYSGVYSDIQYVDLTTKNLFTTKYDIVVCFEVGEHIPREKESVFLDNVSSFCQQPGTVLLSWAVPGQGGCGHVNEQPNEYIIDQMKRRVFKHNVELQNYFRKAASIKWFKNTLMVFER